MDETMKRLTDHHANKSLGAYMVCSMACIDDDFDCNCFIVRINVHGTDGYGADKFATYTKLDILCKRGLYRRKPEEGTPYFVEKVSLNLEEAEAALKKREDD